MALVFADRVQQTGTADTTVSFTLSGSVTGFQTFTAIGNANTTYYSATDINGNWEVGIGTYTTSGTLLTRNTILSSSNSGNAVTFTSTVNVWCDYSAKKSVIQDASGNINLNSFDRHSIRPSLLLDFANTRQLDPRITFARASTATFYDGKTIAVAEQNLLLPSQVFSNAAWVATNATLASGITAPDGTTTAFSVTATGVATVYQTLTTLAVPYTLSLYIQRVTGIGTINLTLDGTTLTPETITTSWARYSITVTPTAASHTIGVQMSIITDVINIWGAQLEQRSVVTAYTPTTTVPITNYIPVLQTAASGVARFDCNPTTSESLGLLIEEQRTNLLTYSDQFDNAIWLKTRCSIIANTIIAPDGTLTGDKIIIDTTNTTTHRVNATPVTLTPVPYTYTVIAKKAEFNYLILQLGFVTNSLTWFDLINGTVSTIGTNVTASIINVGNGWFKCSITGLGIASTADVVLYPAETNGVQTIAVGNGYSGIYIWGAQLEAGSFATSYIPTVASQVTRVADQASMTGTNFSSWYNISEGTIYVSAVAPPTSPSGLVSINDNTSNNRITAQTSSPTTMVYRYVSPSGSFTSTGASYTAKSTIKAAFVYKTNDQISYTNGISDTGITSQPLIPIVTQMQIGFGPSVLYASTQISKISYYPKRLTNAELIGLTS